MGVCSVAVSGCLGVGEIGGGPSGGAFSLFGGSAEPGADGPGDNGGGATSVDLRGQEALVAVAEVEACETRDVPQQPLRRLSSTQWENTLRDLFGESLAAGLLQDNRFPKTRITSGFANDAEANTVNTSESNAIEDEAARIADRVMDDPGPFVSALLPCDVGSAYSDAQVDACIDDFIERFGTRAYRRPMTQGEVDIVRGLYDTLRAQLTATESFGGLLQFFVQAPALLYRVERGAEEIFPGLMRLDDYEMASRLSYFFLDSMPDEELFEAAAAGELSTPAQIEAQARRLIQDPAFHDTLAGFHRDWLHLYELDHAERDPNLFPGFTATVRDSLLEEVGEMVRYVLEERDGNLSTLLGTDMFPVNAVLADWYGVDAPGADEDTWVPVALPDRAGLLNTAAFTAAHADNNRTSPIHRGVFVQREVLCNVLPTLPGDVDIVGPLQDTAREPTARQRLAPLEQGSCAGCHRLFNPTGFGFENFDATGRWRDEENGVMIDASGDVTIDGESVSFEVPFELAEALADSSQVQSCYARQWYRAGVGRADLPQDDCSLATLEQASLDHAGDIREVVVALTQTDGFLYRATTTD